MGKRSIYYRDLRGERKSASARAFGERRNFRWSSSGGGVGSKRGKGPGCLAGGGKGEKGSNRLEGFRGLKKESPRKTQILSATRRLTGKRVKKEKGALPAV